MSKLIIIGSAGAGTTQALSEALKNVDVTFVTAYEAMNKCGEVARLIHDDDNFHQLKLRCLVKELTDDYLEPVPTKQKCQPRSFKNRGKGSKRKQW